MGFLSRKKPKPAPVAVEESHPIDEDLQRMEELVPRQDEGSRSAGPAAEMDTPSSQAADEVPHPTPPAGEAFEADASRHATAEADEDYSEAEADEGEVAVARINDGVEVPERVTGPEAPAERPPAQQLVEAKPEGPARMRPSDLIAPSRADFVVEQEAEPQAPVKHADVIAFANQKGGVAKTTTTLNLAVALAESGHRVLCIDLDPQGNLTMSQGIDPDKVETSLYDVLVNDVPISEIIAER
ncbi:MAG: AAA family ATPase, partial [Solirubrobacterales bacterium]